MMSNLMLKALISPKKLDPYPDPSDPSNPFVHHAPDPGTEMLPERVKLPSLLERKIHMECAISQIAWWRESSFCDFLGFLFYSEDRRAHTQTNWPGNKKKIDSSCRVPESPKVRDNIEKFGDYLYANAPNIQVSGQNILTYVIFVWPMMAPITIVLDVKFGTLGAVKVCCYAILLCLA